MVAINNDMPIVNKKVAKLINEHTYGNIQRFAKMLGMSQQRINRLFYIDKRTKNASFPKVSDAILDKICINFNIKKSWFFENDLEDMPHKTLLPHCDVKEDSIELNFLKEYSPERNIYDMYAQSINKIKEDRAKLDSEYKRIYDLRINIQEEIEEIRNIKSMLLQMMHEIAQQNAGNSISSRLASDGDY